jgi:hypothetical protein
VPEQGHVHAEIGADISVSTSSIDSIVRAAEALDTASRERRLTDSEKLTILQGAAQLGTNPPTVIPHFGVAYAPWEHWEVGLRFASTGWRIAARRQLLWQPEHGVDLTVGLGFGRSVFTPPVGGGTFRIDEYSRWNLDVPVAVGRRGSWYRIWTGPRFVYSTISQSMTLTLPYDMQIQGSNSARAFYVGGYAGAALGYRSVFVGPELTVVWLLGRGDVTALGSTATVDLHAFIVYPAFAVMGEF